MRKKRVLFVILILFLIGIVYAADVLAPKISFVSRKNNTGVNTTNFFLNVSIEDANFSNFTYNWNNGADVASFSFNFTKVSKLMSNLLGFWTMDYLNYSYWIDGSNSGGLEFDGTDDYVNLGDAYNPALNNFSISAWVKTDNTDVDGSFVRILSKGYAVKGYGLYIQGNGQVGVLLHTLIISSNTNDLRDNNWHHVVASFDRGSDVSIYVDSVNIYNASIASQSSTNINNVNDLLIGSYTLDTTQGNFDGSIDEVRIFDKALNQTEVSQLYNHNLINNTGLVGEWLLDEKIGYVANDSSGNGNDGSLEGIEPISYDFSGYENDGAAHGNLLGFSDSFYNGSLEFDGVDDYISVDNIGIETYTPMTFSFWVNPRNTNQYRAIVGYDSSHRFLIQNFASGGKMLVQASGNFFSTIRVNNNQWTNVIYWYNGTHERWYINGTQSGENINADYEWSSDFLIGNYEVGGAYPYSGLIDEIMIWNRSLSDSEIKQLYDSRIRKFSGVDNYSVEYYKDIDSNLGSAILNLTCNDVNMTNYYLAIDQTGLLENERYNYYVETYDSSGNYNTTGVFVIFINSAPSFNSVVNSPSSLNDLDPGVVVNITVNVTDEDDNFNYSIFQWKEHNETEWNNITMTNLSQLGFDTILNVSFTLPWHEGIFTYRILAYDPSEISISSEYNISSYWDCDFNVTEDLGATSGWNQHKNIGNITVMNIGDVNSSTCNLTYRLEHSLDMDKLYFDDYNFNPSNTYTINPNETDVILINATFGETVLQEDFFITTTILVGSPDNTSLNTTATLVTNQEGPYLFLDITSYPTYVYLTNQNFSLKGYVRNLMGSDIINENNTAYNVSFYWTLSGDFATNNNLSKNFTNITDSSAYFRNLNVTFGDLSSMSQGVKRFTLSGYGYNLTGGLIENANNYTLLNDTVEIIFLCYNESDGVCVSSCGYSLDSDCPVPSVDSGTTTGSGGGGGGSYSGEGYSDFVKERFELIIGTKQSFPLVIENKYRYPKEDVKISMRGFDSSKVQIVPDSIDRIDPFSNYTVEVIFLSESYLSQGKYDLVFTFNGLVKENRTSKAYSDKKEIALYLLEISREEAEELINNSVSYIEEMKSFSLSTRQIEEYFEEANSSYLNLDFKNLKNVYDEIDDIYSAAIEAKDLIEDLEERMAYSEYMGISVIESRKVFLVAKVAFERGDYFSSLKNLKEAKLSYALETKGKFNLFVYVKNEPIKSLIIFLISVAFVFIFIFILRSYYYSSRIKMYNKEEVLLLELMKTAQKDCFENNKLSMKEYYDAMIQYEGKLSNAVQRKVNFESKLINFLSFKGKVKSLNSERKKLIDFIKKIQSDYMVKGKLETRVYEAMMKSYSSRLTEVEEQLIFLEARRALRGKGLFRVLLGGKNE